MLTPPTLSRDRRPRGEDGFTLAELSVSMAAAIVVIIGLFSIMVVTLHQTQRTFTKVDATRRARLALSDIENELHSSCLVGNPESEDVDAPIQAGSTASQIVFLSYYGKSANPTPTWHVLSFASGNLVDTSYNVTGSSPSWGQGTLISAQTLLTNVSQQTSGGTAVPVFQYYAYQADGQDANGDTYYVLEDGTNLPPSGSGTPPNSPLSTFPLTTSAANSVVEVRINLVVGPSASTLNNPNLADASDPVTDSVSLRLTTPPDYLPAGQTSPSLFGPCQ
jgi:hypothetical protein